ncbi:hypothetical protein [Niabella beijingensis]|uniref:hypothetical protein n=1 Tax=Niabella beijingensis TaxID=2872700 RepID=UPI001CBA9D9C|nr:hypothetical protein [Niabella beijingensis]MBZ4189663.1 hypothetical protein [Niabella beijingensis]
MKRFPSVLLFLILIAGIIYLFLENRRLREAGSNETRFFVSEGSVNPKDIKLNYVRLDKALEMTGTFRAFQYRYITEGLNRYLGNNPDSTKKTFWDSRLTTFSLDSIKKLVYTMDELIKSGKLVKPDGSKVSSSELGIKMYDAAYPGLQPQNADYAGHTGRHTLILVPAYKDRGTAEYHDFLPSGEIPDKGKRTHTLFAPAQNGRTMTTMGFLPPPLAVEVGLNQGGACPPPSVEGN